MDCSVDPSASGQSAVGRVHQRVDLLLGDVSLGQFERATVDRDLHGRRFLTRVSDSSEVSRAEPARICQGR